MVAYNRDIPFSTNNPSTDQPNMQTNTNSVDDILQVDHVSFNATNGGTHKQVTYSSENVPSSPGGTSSVAYTGIGIADPSHPQHFWTNSQGIYPLSAIRAFGSFVSGSNGTLTPGNSYNLDAVTPVVQSGASNKVFTIKLLPNVVSGNNVTVLVFLSDGSKSFSTTAYTFVNPNLVVNVSGSTIGYAVNFVVLQI